MPTSPLDDGDSVLEDNDEDMETGESDEDSSEDEDVEEDLPYVRMNSGCEASADNDEAPEPIVRKALSPHEQHLRRVHHHFLSVLPRHLAPTAFYVLNFVSTIPSVDNGRFLLALYVEISDLIDHAIPALTRSAQPFVTQSQMTDIRRKISRLYIHLCTYGFSLSRRDMGLLLSTEYDMLLRAQPKHGTLYTLRINIAQHCHTSFRRTAYQGDGNPFLTLKECFWFLGMADIILQEHAHLAKRNVSVYYDPMFVLLMRLANEKQEGLPPMG